MLVSSGHVLRIPDNRPFDTYEHKTPLLAISETWGSAAGHNHVVGRQGLCYTISRDYFGYGRSVHAIRRHLKKIYSARRRDVVADGTTPCEECGVPWCGKEHGTMVYCDGCNKVYHSLSCLHPPLIEIPEDDWFCPHCAVDTTASL